MRIYKPSGATSCLAHRRRRMWMLVLCHLFLVGITVTAAWGQSNDCIEMVRSAYGRMSLMTDGSRSIAVRYTVRTTMKDTTHVPTSSSVIEARMSRSLLYVKAAQFESIRDTTVTATAIHASRAIYVTDALPESGRPAGGDPFAMLRDSLLVHAKLIESSDLDDSGTAVKRVLIEPSAEAQLRYGLKRIAFVIDSAKQVLRAMTLGYADASPLLSVTITFDDIQYRGDESEVDDLHVKGADDAIAMLHAKYAAYRVIDRRTNRRSHQ